MAGAVGAVSRTLDQFQSDMKAAQDLVASGERVVGLETALVGDSILKDRMETDAAGQAALASSIAESGQQVPILVRPDPGRPGAYQVAYGHRRLAACRALGRKVLAIVRPLSDRDLLVAQGQENSARRDLSFIERATFALKLEQRGIEREAVMAALSTDKTEVSKLIAVAHAVPAALVAAIGPAPKAGRPRWLALAERLRGPQGDKKIAAVLSVPAFAGLSSDERFGLVFDWFGSKPKRGRAPEPWRAADGKKVARIERSDRSLTLALDNRAAPDFGQFIVDQLPSLYAAYAAGRAGR